jgi:hypothetical protein
MFFLSDRADAYLVIKLGSASHDQLDRALAGEAVRLTEGRQARAAVR